MRRVFGWASITLGAAIFGVAAYGTYYYLATFHLMYYPGTVALTHLVTYAVGLTLIGLGVFFLKWKKKNLALEEIHRIGRSELSASMQRGTEQARR